MTKRFKIVVISFIIFFGIALTAGVHVVSSYNTTPAFIIILVLVIFVCRNIWKSNSQE